jgi:hypothetical protein
MDIITGYPKNLPRMNGRRPAEYYEALERRLRALDGLVERLAPDLVELAALCGRCRGGGAGGGYGLL